jgi:hypothetical protein
MARSFQVGGDPLTGGRHFLVGEGAVLGFPFGNGRQPVADEECPPRGLRHPRGDADAVLLGGGHDSGVDVGADGDGQLRGGLSARHAASLPPQ